jgi:predicted O-methyltransferase YrrM
VAALPDPTEWVRQVHADGGGPLLRDLARDAAARGLPVLGPSLAALVAALARSRGGARYLDLGAGNGYASVWLGRVAREVAGRVVAVERDATLARETRATLAKAGLDGVVEVVHGDPLEYLQGEGEDFDLVVLGIRPEERAAALPAVAARLRPRGLLVADHAGEPDGHAYSGMALSDARLDTAVLWGLWPGHDPEWDAVALSVRRPSDAGVRLGTLG